MFALANQLSIRGIEIYPFDLPLITPFRISLGEMKTANDVLIRIITDQGIVGIGEACPFPPITRETQATTIAAARMIRDMMIGKDPLAIESLLKGIEALAPANPSATAAFEMALFEILGKVAGLSLFRLLGGDKAAFETDITTSIDTAEAMAANAKKHADRGYQTIKIKVGLDPDEDFGKLKAIRDAIGYEITLRIDANQGWTVAQAVYALKNMERFHIEFVEQPVAASDIPGLKAVKAQTSIPIMADEALFSPADALNLIRAEACDYLNIKLMKAGGILNSIRIAHIAGAAKIRCMLGCMVESRIALTAAAHVVASQSNIVFADLDGNAEHLEDPVIDGIRVKGGWLTLPEKPGLGCDVDPAFLRRSQKI